MSFTQQIRDHISALPRGTAVTSRTFTGVTSLVNIYYVLSHLENVGFLERTGRGVYRRPLEDPAEPAVLLAPTREQVQQYIETHFPEGQPFAPAELAALGPRHHVQPVLSLLTHDDTVRRLALGVYVRPGADQPQTDHLPLSGTEHFRRHLEMHVPRGQPFTAEIFDGLFPRLRSRSILHWMARRGQIARVRRGVFIQPLNDQKVTEALPLSHQVRQHIERHLSNGQPFTPDDLDALGHRSGVATALSRLKQSGWIVHVRRGVYLRPPEPPISDTPDDESG